MAKCRDVMTKDPAYCSASESIVKVAQLMKQEDVGSVPVVESADNQRLVGIVSLGDLARETDEQTAGHALEGISAPGSQHQQ